VAYTDDTGWRVGGDGAYLMAFDADRETVYQSGGYMAMSRRGRLFQATTAGRW
jgi:hypothetical protein